jgi:hypothetical protein
MVIQASALPDQSHVTGLTWNRLKCSVADRHKHEPTFQKGWEEGVTGEWMSFSFVSCIALNIEINICTHSFPHPLTAYKLR